MQGKDLLLQLEDETLKLVEPQSQALLHAQPIVSIRVWGVGRDSGRWAQESVGWGWGLTHSAVRILFSNLFFGSLVLPDPERGIDALLLWLCPLPRLDLVLGAPLLCPVPSHLLCWALSPISACLPICLLKTEPTEHQGRSCHVGAAMDREDVGGMGARLGTCWF